MQLISKTQPFKKKKHIQVVMFTSSGTGAAARGPRAQSWSAPPPIGAGATRHAVSSESCMFAALAELRLSHR